MKTILVVDDESKIGQLACDYLEHAGSAAITARSEESDKLIGVGSDTDDYLTKSFCLKELAARLSIQLQAQMNLPAAASSRRCRW